MNKLIKYLYSLAILLLAPNFGYAMHIAEGYLPPVWSGLYFLLALPFVYLGIRDIKRKGKLSNDMKLFIAVAGAYCFILSALKLPSVTGSSSHPTGTGFGAIIFGPFIMSVVSTIVLLFQSLFLAHGGLTTLGANTFSMGVVGPLVAFGVYKLAGKNKKLGIFLAAALGDLATYVVTAIQLALAHPSEVGGLVASLEKFLSIFAITQIPLAIAEGILTVLIFNIIEKYSKDDLEALKGDLSYEK
ncbi:cobalamin (vitamin B12) biosynthesis protein CbiM [Gottschalkia acidurici 9a]|uniref:Cobalt transport protein CbiM n=1 Tax=Gottschalkia acidurici (strain ATCC 7906 / DSM 604 / BCRC 14475 / CIP 104303 / KCTC 5404 / NCIMB 10678 / 9a) TaxID=1128398 RepID=K0B3P4_GOTA9|nr:energy-coupling factor ABC transporter permease [Gottschalkia acidurici]AFS79490.1 cobalamin (vitamin B12) biosynthesis protein CbiM [Gottschalkia acidurici 9a]